ncbi:hypothetical protein ACFL3T_00060 [Patescibacteria group bacterium]
MGFKPSEKRTSIEEFELEETQYKQSVDVELEALQDKTRGQLVRIFRTKSPRFVTCAEEVRYHPRIRAARILIGSTPPSNQQTLQ